MDYVFDAGERPSVAVLGQQALFPVHRVYCVGRNYAAHAREMGADPMREPPFFFLKAADALANEGSEIPYPPRTHNLHHEIELVVAIGRGGQRIAAAAADAHVFGYAVGNDLTRRDLQFAARDKGRPWDTGKTFDHAAVVSAIAPVERVGHPRRGRIWLAVNGELRQQSDLDQMIWSVPEIVAELSTYFRLLPGDLIYTGTPEGVGALAPGDRLTGGVDGVGTLNHTIGPPA